MGRLHLAAAVLVSVVFGGGAIAQSGGCGALREQAEKLAENFVRTLVAADAQQSAIIGLDAQVRALNDTRAMTPTSLIDLLGLNPQTASDLIFLDQGGTGSSTFDHLRSANLLALHDERRAAEAELERLTSQAALQQLALSAAVGALEACDPNTTSETTTTYGDFTVPTGSILPQQADQGWLLQFDVFHTGETVRGDTHTDTSPQALRWVVDDQGRAYEGGITFVSPASRRGVCDMGIDGTDAGVYWHGSIGHPGFRNTVTATVTRQGALDNGDIALKVTGTLHTEHDRPGDGRYSYEGSFQGDGVAKRITMTQTAAERAALCGRPN